MRILITNDDSISASQLVPLINWAKKLGEVTVVVPKVEQSGKSHGIELHAPFSIEKTELVEGVEAYVVDSTPADCVRYAILGMKEKYDLVISGVNRGYNIGSDMMYSGTVAAVREAQLQKVPAIALSTSPEYYEKAVAHLDEVYNYIVENKLLEVHNAYNINIPENPKGFKITRQGGIYYSDSFPEVEKGMYMASGILLYEPSNDLTLDTDATLSGYYSIMPLTLTMTEMDIFNKLSK